MAAGSTIGLVAAFAAGVVSFLSPCVLPLVPGYVSFIAGNAQKEDFTASPSRRSVLWLGFCFVFGFSLVFVLLGAGASALGQWLLSYRYELNIVGGVFVIAFGLLSLGPCGSAGCCATCGSTSTSPAAGPSGRACWVLPSPLVGHPASARSWVLS